MAREKMTRSEMEKQRLAAVRDFLAGTKQAVVVRKYGVTRTTASRWAHEVSVHGDGALEVVKMKKAPGRRSRLTPEQLEKFRELWHEGPAAYNEKWERWTMVRFAKVVRERMGVSYHHDYVGRLTIQFGLREKEFSRSHHRSSAPDAITRGSYVLWPVNG